MIDISTISREELAAIAIAEYGVPDHCADGLAGYLTRDYRDIGDFLIAVLSNDLKSAVMRADDINRHALYQYVHFLYAVAPAQAWGSPEAVSAWLNAMGNGS